MFEVEIDFPVPPPGGKIPLRLRFLEGERGLCFRHNVRGLSGEKGTKTALTGVRAAF
jgi:hypothetical protein